MKGFAEFVGKGSGECAKEFPKVLNHSTRFNGVNKLLPTRGGEGGVGSREMEGVEKIDKAADCNLLLFYCYAHVEEPYPDRVYV